MTAQPTGSMQPKVVLTMVAAGILALLASCGVYNAAQPDANKGQQAELTYGTK